jgi:hypothetical protein
MTTPAAAPAGAPDSTRGAPDSNAGHRFFLAPLRHTKTLYLIRHGEGYHNLFGEVDRAMYASEKFFDSHLTPKGWEQCNALKAGPGLLAQQLPSPAPSFLTRTNPPHLRYSCRPPPTARDDWFAPAGK